MLPHPLSEYTAPSIPIQRNQHSCSQCRNDKQKCLPLRRDWQNMREKCHRCARLDHECGPPERATRRIRNTSISKARKEMIALKTIRDLPGMESGDNRCAERSSPVQGTFDLKDSFAMLPFDMNTVIENPGMMKADGEITSNAIARMSDINTLRELLFEARVYETSACGWLGGASQMTGSTDALIAATENEFRKEAEICIEQICSEEGHEGDVTISAVLQAYYRYSNPREFKRSAVDCPLLNTMQHILQLSRKGRKGFETDPMRGSSREILPCDDGRYQTVLTYVDASKAISHVLKELDMGQVYSDSFQLRQFPAEQIAYLNSNYSALLELWNGCQSSPPSDVIGRTLLHLVVYYSDFELLKKLPLGVIDARDIFGLTPLQIAVCRDDLECFDFLLRHRADGQILDLCGRSTLALAARTGSLKIVKHIIATGRVPVSLRSELLEALESGNEEVVSEIVAYHEHQVGPPDDAIQRKAVQVAEVKGLSKMVDRIQSLGMPQSIREAALQSLAQPNHDDELAMFLVGDDNMGIDPEFTWMSEITV